VSNIRDIFVNFFKDEHVYTGSNTLLLK